MSAAHPSSFIQDQGVLGELLHFMSQPLTSLRCSLELSLDDAAEPQQTSFVLALQQTEQVIGMIQLMREYLDAEQTGAEVRTASLDQVLRNVIEDVSAIAEVRGIGLRIEGTCSATVAVPAPRLRLALQYLGVALMAWAGEGGTLLFSLEEGSTESALRAKILGSTQPPDTASSTQDTILRVRFAIAQKILETGGMLLTTEDRDHAGFALRIPRMLAASRSIA
jgi:hypothetical protein